MERREFIALTGACAAGLAVAGMGSRLYADEPPLIQKKAKVVDYRNPAWKNKKGPDAAVIRSMIEEGLKAFTGKSTAAAAWKEFVSPTEIVGIKFNNLSGNHTKANQMILDAIVAGLLAAGVKRGNIIPVEAVDAKFEAEREADMGRETEVDYGHGKTQLTNYLVKQVDALINVPNIKDHSLAGVTGALKNFSHSSSLMTNPGAGHGNCCDPFIAEINALKPIIEKRRLTITNGLIGVFNGGPDTSNPQFHFPHDGFLIGTDPVALDTYQLGIVEAARKEKGLASLHAGSNRPIHLKTAAEMGLGTHNLDEVDIVKIVG